MMRSPIRALAAAALLLAVTVPSAAADTVAADTMSVSSVDIEDHPTVSFTLRVPSEITQVRIDEGDGYREAEVSQESSESLQVVLLIDVTGSMSGGAIEAARTAATVFLEQLPTDVDVAVLSYDTETTVVSGFGSTRDEHIAGVAGLQADGSTAMYDAVLTTLDDVLPEAGGDDRQAIILLTDGEDNSSTATLEETTERLADSGVSLDGVAYQTDRTDEAGLQTLVEATGGRVNDADDPESLAAAYRQLADDLINRYQVRYDSEAFGTTDLVIEAVTTDGVTLQATHTVDLPAAPTEDTTAEATPPVDAEVAPPATPARTALIVGAVAWFSALALLLLILFLPGERRAQRLASSAHAGRPSREVSAITERVTLATGRTLERRGYRRGLNLALERAGIELRPEEFVVLVGVGAAVASAVGGLFGGVLGAVTLGPLVIVGARVLVTVLADRRKAAFAAQLGDTLQLLTGSLRAGYSLMQAVDAVARDADSPTAEEFSRLVVETRLGRDATATLSALAERMGSDDFAWVVQAITIHREVGGDLAEVLDNVGATIRERDEIRRQIRTVSAEGRLSGIVLIALPIVMALWLSISNPTYLGELTRGGVLGWSLLGACAVLMLAGALWIRSLVRVKF